MDFPIIDNFELSEIFISHENLSNNLLPEERILYKLKSKIDLEYHLYITDIRIYLINNAYHRFENRYSIKLDDLQCVSIRKKIPALGNKDSGEIEFISDKIRGYVDVRSSAKKHSYFFPVKNNFSCVIQKIESILWHYGKIDERIKTLRKNNPQIPFDFKDFYKNNRLKKTNKKSSRLIEFNPDLYMTYYPNYNPLEKSYESFGRIIFKSNYDSKIKIIYQYDNNSLKLLEIVYFHLLDWKFKNKSLINEETLLNLQKNWKINNDTLIKKFEARKKKTYSPQQLKRLMKNRYFDSTIKNINNSKLLKKLYLRYEEYLEKDENILLYYKGTLFNKRTLLIFPLVLPEIFFIYLVISGYSGFYPVVFIFSILFVFLPFIFTNSFKRCVFTSKKIIFEKYKGIGSSSYRNIESITFNRLEESEHIFFELINPMDTQTMSSHTVFNVKFVPKKLQLYDKIIELRDKYKNLV